MKRIILLFLSAILLYGCTKESASGGDTGSVLQPIIYFQASNNSGAYGWEEIFSMNEDGTALKQLTNFSASGTRAIATLEPALSPDGTKLFFISYKDFNGGEVFSMNADGTGSTTKIISNNIAGSALRDLAISHDGQKIAYTLETDSFANRHGTIFIANSDGSGKTALTVFPADGNCYHPCFSPSGSTIVYSNLIGSGIHLYKMAVNGSNKQVLTAAGPSVKLHPQFSPDGLKIVFDAIVGIGSEIFIMDADGTNIKPLTNYSVNGTKNNITWGAAFYKDSRTIYFASDELNGRISQLYKMNSDGNGKIKLTSSAEDKFNPFVK